MICPQCQTKNDDEYVFCVNCGATIGNPANALPEQETVFANRTPIVIEPPRTSSRPADIPVERPRRSILPWAFGLLVAMLVIGGVGGYFAYKAISTTPPKVAHLPEHLGLFSTKADGSGLVELKKLESTNVIDSRNSIGADSSLVKTAAQPELILYADASEVPISDLKFVRIDTISDDGKAKYLDFQAAIVDGKPAMKRIRFSQPLSDGKYAFALFSGFANEGKHRFWPLEVKAGARGAAFTQELSLNLKPASSPTPTASKTPENTGPPVGATVAYLTRTDVWLRKTPALQDKGKLSLLKPRQKVYVIRYSSNSDTWEGINSNWALVQTENGKQGWVFNAFLDHGK